MTDRRIFTPKPWQPLMYQHVYDNPRCALWATMGAGKGVATLTPLADLEVTEDVFPALALGPKRVARDVWPNECDKWEHLKHLKCVSLVGDLEHRLRAVKYDSPIHSINYESLPWLYEYYGEERWPYKTIIADESTKLKSYRGGFRVSKLGNEYIQNITGKRAGALAKVAHGPRVKRFIQLTGTPSPNGLQDLWGQVWFLDRGARLGKTHDEGFTQRWFRPKKNGFGVEPLPHAFEEIQEKLKDICLTVDVGDYIDVKAPIVNNIYVQLPPGARQHYTEMEKEMFTKLAGENTVEAFGAAAKTQKCLQIANGAVYVDPLAGEDAEKRSKEWRPVHEAKMEALDSIVEEFNGAPMMVVYAFRSDLARIMKAYPRAVDLSSTKGLAAFRKGGVPIGLCHPDSLGHGVDGLQDVCHVITHFGHGWNLETYDQVNARVGQIRQIQSGYDRPVYVNHIIAEGTVDELVMERRDSKREVQDILMDAMKRKEGTQWQ